jgi:flavin reductase (DIM6/NTAB) family NADH-FMN oxidoreductase RutF
MTRISIPIEDFTVQAYSIWEIDWFLLTSGDFAAGQYNTMTVSWGSLGCMWGRPFAQVVVRPHRYTYEFMEQYPTFTLSAFAPQYRPALDLLGAMSGRDGDKIREAGLTAEAAGKVPAPGFAEARLVLECRKLYWQNFDPAHFVDSNLNKNYPRGDYHCMYYGEILAVSAEPSYLRARS